MRCAIAVVWTIGIFELPGLIGVDTDCLDRRIYYRGELAEFLICSMQGGPRGWLLLVWILMPFVLIGRPWRRLKARSRKNSEGKDKP